MSKYAWIRQQSSEDCAAASLAIVLKHYGKNIPINRVREAIGTQMSGTNLLGLKRGAESLGFIAKGFQAQTEWLENLDNATLPTILYWQGYHFVVLLAKEGEKFVLSDPGIGIRYVDHTELLESWQGNLALLLKPHPFKFPLIQNNHQKLWTNWRKRLFPLRWYFLGLLLLNVLFSGTLVAVPILQQILIDYLWQSSILLPSLMMIFISLGGVVLFNFGLNFAHANLVTFLIKSLETSLRTDFGEQLLQLPLPYFETRSYGTIQLRLSDIAAISQLFDLLLVNLPTRTFCGLLGLTVLYLYHPVLSLNIAAIAILLSAIFSLVYPRIQQANYRIWLTSGQNFFLLSQIFVNALTIKTTASASFLKQELLLKQEEEITANVQNSRINNLINSLLSLLSELGKITILAVTCWLFLQQKLTLGTFVAVVFLANLVIEAGNAWLKFILEFTKIKTQIQELEELFHVHPETSENNPNNWLELSPQQDIVCKQLNFQYPGRLPLLKDFSATLPGGQIIAIIGHSGCGKSTLVKLLTRLYTLQKGDIFFGTDNLQDLPLECLRRQIVLVSQESRFLTRSIADNLRLGVPDATMEELVAACEIAAAGEFINLFPERYDTILGDFSANLSDGQKQRIGLARAVLMNPPVLILDEATANLDPPTEARVLDALLAQRQGKTTILVSHRPRVIARANWIILIEHGETKFKGTISDFRNLAGAHLEFLNP
ncbi:ATP-binding cassette domain-containing protein [Nostoc sp. KVJ3]|uniref:peptidase domain-containing ABC transporter n=1 Tax=Nostoc sp. KVJ3 TaxID=457945 RepID=UPI0022376633|nr:peptidase domain-containing ABC transporter [Nostoc sp. KVJ3]MCW5317194.1 ATP-binding cassette domain-containing protein [Nostoc sp. KVJ3]